MQLRARALSSGSPRAHVAPSRRLTPVAEQRGARLLSGISQVRLLAGVSGPFIYGAKSLAFQAGEPGANPGRAMTAM